jgi:tetratricopeptide (TPR) repeat protein
MVVLAAISYEFLFYAFKNRIAQIAVLVVLGAAFGKPLFWIIKNHPNQYVYFNETVGGINGAYGNYETDYYSNSCRAAGEWIAQQEPGKGVRVGINNEPLTASYYAHRINPDLDIFWVREYEEYRPRWDYLILTSRTFGHNELRNGGFPPKGTVHVIKADDIPLCVVIKRENNYMPDGYDQLERRSYDSAIVNFRKACEYDPMNEESFRMLGTAYMLSGNPDSAKIALRRAIEIFPQNYSAYNVMGQVFYGLQQPDSAIYYFKQTVHYKRNVTEAYYYAAMCEMSRNNHGAAIPYLEEALKHSGQIFEIYYNLGVAYYNTGSYKKAEDALSAALGLNPKSAQAYLVLAEVFKKTNDMQKYNVCMQRYQELGGR